MQFLSKVRIVLQFLLSVTVFDAISRKALDSDAISEESQEPEREPEP